jgi:HAD superfamily hydrolase (TIGR01549 family)
VKLKGLIFDLDGTIVDAPYDWSRIRDELDTGGLPILKHLDLLDEPERSRKWAVLEAYEKKATENAVLMQGIPRLMDLISSRGVRTALVSNNSGKNVRFLVEKFRLEFEIVLSREDGLWKPSAGPFLRVLGKWGMKRDDCGVVGDALFDVQAAEAAGIRRILIVNTNRDRARFEDTGAEVFDSIPALQERLSCLI